MRSLFPVTVLIAGVGILASGCGSSSSPTDAPGKQNITAASADEFVVKVPGLT